MASVRLAAPVCTMVFGPTPCHRGPPAVSRSAHMQSCHPPLGPFWSWSKPWRGRLPGLLGLSLATRRLTRLKCQADHVPEWQSRWCQNANIMLPVRYNTPEIEDWLVCLYYSVILGMSWKVLFCFVLFFSWNWNIHKGRSLSILVFIVERRSHSLKSLTK